VTNTHSVTLRLIPDVIPPLSVFVSASKDSPKDEADKIGGNSTQREGYIGR
jgi:hypothetical protein